MSRILLIGLLFLLIIGCKKEKPNTPPVAFFTITPEGGSVDTLFVFNASASGDREDEDSLLQIRWDFESDSVWDTKFSNQRITNHRYSKEGKYLVSLELTDTEGLRDLLTIDLIVRPTEELPDPELVLLGPGPEMISKETGVTFNWTANQELGYKVMLGRTNPPVFFAETRDTFLYIPDLERNSEYFWAIEGFNNYGDTVRTEIEVFYISFNKWDKLVFLRPNPAESAERVKNPVSFSLDVHGDFDIPTGYTLFYKHKGQNHFFESYEGDDIHFVEDVRFANTEIHWMMGIDTGNKVIYSPIYKFWSYDHRGYPEIPFNPQPANGSKLVTNRVSLSWSANHQNPEWISSMRFNVFLGIERDPQQVGWEQEEMVFRINDLKNNQTYYWRVEVTDPNNHLVKGPLWEFRTGANLVPYKANPISPKPGSMLFTNPQRWTWSAEDPENDLLKYDVYFGEYPQLELIHQRLGVSEMSGPTNLKPDAHYIWRTDVIDVAGNKTRGDTIFLHTPPATKLKMINHYISDTVYDISNFEYDHLGRMVSKMTDGFSVFYNEYIWIRKDSVVYEYDELNRVKKLDAREKYTGSNGWFFYDNEYVVNHVWENDTTLVRYKGNGDINDIFIYDASGRMEHFYHYALGSIHTTNFDYDGGFLPSGLKYFWDPQISGSYNETWTQSMEYDGHHNPYSQIPFLRYYRYDRRTSGYPTEYYQNITHIDRHRSYYGRQELINISYEYDSNGYVTTKWVEGNQASEYWEFIYE